MRYRYRVLGFLSVLSVITYVDRICISVAGKTIQDDLGLNPQQWGWVLGAFVLSYGLFEIPAGALGDRIGPRRVLGRIVIWWSAFTALTGAVKGFWQLIATRFLFGAGEAGAYPNSAVAIGRWFPARERARAQGVVWMASRIGGALTPFLVIPILQAYGWRTSFVVFGAAGVAWAILWLAWFRDNPADKREITEAELAEIASTGGTIPGHASLPWRTALRRPNLWWIMLMYHTYSWSGFFYLGWLHTFLENGRGYTKADLLAWSWLPFVFGATANLLGGFASDALVKRAGLKWGRRAIGVTGLSIAASFTLAAMFTQDKVLTVVLLAVGYAGSDFMMPTAWAVCLDVGRKHAGAVSGAMNMAGQAGSFLTAVIFGYIVGAWGYDAPLIPMAAMTAIGALAWLKIDATKPLIDE